MGLVAITANLPAAIVPRLQTDPGLFGVDCATGNRLVGLLDALRKTPTYI